MSEKEGCRKERIGKSGEKKKIIETQREKSGR